MDKWLKPKNSLPQNVSPKISSPKISSPKISLPKISLPKISLSELTQYLFEAANILRGPVDKSDYKTYIFPLLFFKRISDVYDEEFQKALTDSGGDMEYATFAENHRFIIPKTCHWKDVRSVTVNVGLALTNALREIEKANPKTLFGIFGDAQWTNKERLPDRLLNNLIEHFSKYNLSNSNVEPDIAGQAYEYLIKKFADLSKKKAGEFYTPRTVVRLMTLILDPNVKETVYDPACGTGGMLLEAAHRVKEKGGDIRLLKLYGQEKNLTTSAIARMNLILHGLEDFNIIRNDTLRNPSFYQENELMKFDCVIANPPFSLKKWGADLWMNDPFKRNFAGVPPEMNGDFAWVQHMISSMKKPNGRMAVVLPYGALYRMGSEAEIRQKIIELDILDAVITLGPNLFYGTVLAACILIFRLKKEEKKQKKVIFIDGSTLYKKGRAQNSLTDELLERIYNYYLKYVDVENYVKIVSIDLIRNFNFNLNLSNFIKYNEKTEEISLDKSSNNLKNHFEALFADDSNLTKFFQDRGIIK